jgi:hypothetical protein
MPLFWIALSDYAASLGLILTVVVWGLALVGRYFDPEAADFFLTIAPYVTLAGLALTVWRVWAIRSVLVNGTEVEGVVSGVSFRRGRRRVRFAYTYQGQKHQGANRVQSLGVGQALAPGQPVTVVVDPGKPGRAYVRELFVRDG